MLDPPLPPAGRYRLHKVGPPPDRHREVVGRSHFTFTGETAERRQRRALGPIVETFDVVEVVKPGANTWELAAADGSVWRLSGCGCG